MACIIQICCYKVIKGELNIASNFTWRPPDDQTSSVSEGQNMEGDNFSKLLREGSIYIQLWLFFTWVLYGKVQIAMSSVFWIVFWLEVFFNFQCIYFCCKKIIHNFLFAKNIQLIWNLFQSAIWGWWRWWVWEISLEANQFIKRMDHNWWLSLGLYQTWFHPGIFLCLW